MFTSITATLPAASHHTPSLFSGIGMPGSTELIVILVIVMIFFGVGKLPKVLSEMGKGVRAFKDGMKGDEEEGGARRTLDVTEQAERSKVSEAEEVRR